MFSKAAIELFSVVQFTQLQLRGVYDLVCVGTIGRALHIDRAHEVVRRCHEAEGYAITCRRDLGLDIRESSSAV